MPTPSFVDHVTDLAAIAFQAGAGAAVPGATTRIWAVPAGYPVGTPLYDPAGLAAACDRTDLNALVTAAYAAAGPNAGRLGQVMAGKLALDHVACRERALQARHATPQRLRAWAALRRSGHADATLGVFGAFSAVVNDTYAAATAAPNSQG
jgi:hypothetical protein